MLKLALSGHYTMYCIRKLNGSISKNHKTIQLNAFDRFSRSLKMEVNMDKSKVMVMQKQKYRAKARKNCPWRRKVKKTPRDIDFCPYCKMLNTLAVENEIHFVLACSLFNKEGERFLLKIHRIFPSTATLNDFNMYIWLMSQDDYNTTKCLATFCKNSIAKRSKFLSDPNSI